jgi:NAD(P)H dehydrogenase (quinone)
MPGWVYRWVFGAHSLKSLERNVLKIAGIKPIRESIYGMVEAATDAKRAGLGVRNAGSGAQVALGC